MPVSFCLTCVCGVVCVCVWGGVCVQRWAAGREKKQGMLALVLSCGEAVLCQLKQTANGCAVVPFTSVAAPAAVHCTWGASATRLLLWSSTRIHHITLSWSSGHSTSTHTPIVAVEEAVLGQSSSRAVLAVVPLSLAHSHAATPQPQDPAPLPKQQQQQEQQQQEKEGEGSLHGTKFVDGFAVVLDGDSSIYTRDNAAIFDERSIQPAPSLSPLQHLLALPKQSVPDVSCAVQLLVATSAGNACVLMFMCACVHVCVCECFTRWPFLPSMLLFVSAHHVFPHPFSVCVCVCVSVCVCVCVCLSHTPSR